MANEKSQQVLDELVELSVETIRLCEKESLPRSVVDQLIRSVTSIGAKFAEAQDTSSKKDLINKIYIAKKEATETKYWLTLARRLTGNAEYSNLSDRVQKFIMMLQKIVNSSKEANRT